MFNKRGMDWWHRWFLGLAEYVSTASKDPSTKVGAVIVRPDKTVCSVGYNGFPKGVEDKKEHYEDRSEKYQRVVHAELNALMFAQEPMRGYDIYVWPIPPCDRCSGPIIQSGIKRVITFDVTGDQNYARWQEALSRADDMFKQAGVERISLKK